MNHIQLIMQNTQNELTPEEQEGVEGLRQFCQAKGLTGYDDKYLLRFVRARKCVKKDVELMFGRHAEWREKERVDQIESFVPKGWQKFTEFYPHGYHKTDRQGRPIYIERVGRYKVDQLFQYTNNQQLSRYHIKSYETLLKVIFPACSKAAGKQIAKTCVIIDLNGISWSMANQRVYDFIRIASNLAQDNYPEILGNMFIINAPFLFAGAWKIIQKFLDKKTQAKIRILDDSYIEVLTEFIDSANLPLFLQKGTSQQPLESNIGPWNPTGSLTFYENVKLKPQEPPAKQQLVSAIAKRQQVINQPETQEQQLFIPKIKIKEKEFKDQQKDEVSLSAKQLCKPPQIPQKRPRAVPQL